MARSGQGLRREGCWGLSELGTSPCGSGWQFDGSSGKQAPTVLIGECRRQCDLDAGGHFADAHRDFKQAEAKRVELSIAPE